MRSSTSVAAYYRASRHAQSKAVFIFKLSIVVEETDESEFWLDMLCKSKVHDTEVDSTLKNEARRRYEELTDISRITETGRQDEIIHGRRIVESSKYLRSLSQKQ